MANNGKEAAPKSEIQQIEVDQLGTDHSKHQDVALKSSHDNLGLLASAWRFRKVRYCQV